MGIHHISKQNQEHWIPVGADATHGLLFHYRMCLEGYDVTCESTSLDDTSPSIYGYQLQGRYNKSIIEIRK